MFGNVLDGLTGATCTGNTGELTGGK